eukprot:113183-Pelagomonas_calceolata.AAC.2
MHSQATLTEAKRSACDIEWFNCMQGRRGAGCHKATYNVAQATAVQAFVDHQGGRTTKQLFKCPVSCFGLGEHLQARDELGKHSTLGAIEQRVVRVGRQKNASDDDIILIGKAPFQLRAFVSKEIARKLARHEQWIGGPIEGPMERVLPNYRVLLDASNPAFLLEFFALLIADCLDLVNPRGLQNSGLSPAKLAQHTSRRGGAHVHNNNYNSGSQAVGEAPAVQHGLPPPSPSPIREHKEIQMQVRELGVQSNHFCLPVRFNVCCPCRLFPATS